MKRVILLLGSMLLLSSSIIAVDGSDVNIIVDENHKSILESGEVTFPIEIDNIDNIRAFSVILKYKGEFETVEFEPSDYLHEPLILPLKIDKVNNTITITGSATNKVVTRESNGALGSLIFNKDSKVSLFEVAEAEYVDDKYRLVPIVSTGKISQPVENEKNETGLSENYETRLNEAFPNPANPATTISFSIEEQENVSLKIYGVNGQLVRTLVDKEMDQGKYSIDWNGKDDGGSIVASGIYFYKFIAGDYSSTKKIVIIK